MASITVQSGGGLFSNPLLVRSIGWSNLSVMFVYLFNNFVTFWGGWPGASFGNGPIGLFQILLYPAAVVLALILTFRQRDTTLRQDSNRISDMNVFLIRGAFWAVLLLGCVDSVIAFLRVEGMLASIVGENMDKNLGRSQFRGLYVHFPLMIIGVYLATRTKTLGFHWLALLILVGELLIVICRFIFSYEQAFMSDLVRFWYGALFLFASAHTLLEEGHVRVDIVYASLKEKTKGKVNAIGTIFLGITLCWMIILTGMAQKTSIINSPILNFETTQSGFGLYLKYMMAAFLGIFAVSMMIQFISYLLAAVADYHGEDGKYVPNGSGVH